MLLGFYINLCRLQNGITVHFSSRIVKKLKLSKTGVISQNWKLLYPSPHLDQITLRVPKNKGHFNMPRQHNVQSVDTSALFKVTNK